MNHCESLALMPFVSALAPGLAQMLPDRELALAGALLSQLGDTLNTIAAQRALCRKETPQA